MTLTWDKASIPVYLGPNAKGGPVAWEKAVLTPTQVDANQANGSFAGGASVTVDVPADLAALCLKRSGIRSLTLSGTVTLGSNSLPVTLFEAGSGVSTPGSGPYTIVDGPDGALWFTGNAGGIGRITTAGVVTTFDAHVVGGARLTVGPDGALWFPASTASSFGNSGCSGTFFVGRITTSGVVSYFSVPAGPGGLTAGPDGALWFTTSGCNGQPESVDRITTSGSITTYADPGLHRLGPLVVGSDGALWFTDAVFDPTLGQYTSDAIGRVTTSGAFSYVNDPGVLPGNLVAGPDGALWFANYGQWNDGPPPVLEGTSIGRVTTSGVLTTFSDPAIEGPVTLTVGPDGALWFYNQAGGCFPPIVNGTSNDCFFTSSIGSITTSGVITPYPYAAPFGTGFVAGVSGPLDSLWFTSYGNVAEGSIVQVSMSGTATSYAAVNSLGLGIASANDLVVGPDGAIWFADYGNDTIGRLAVS